MVIFSLGISGSGKSYYGKKLKEKIPNLKIICPDDVRFELTGDVSDQSKNVQVFQIVEQRLEEAMFSNIPVYYSATNLNKLSRKDIIRLAEKYKQDIICVIFLTSYRPDICEQRVKDDLADNVVRANTMVRDDKGDTIIRRQFKSFVTQMDNINQLKEELKNLKYKITFVECATED